MLLSFLLIFVFEVVLGSLQTTTINTGLGPIKGLQQQTDHGRNIWTFRGIPYAKPPLKQLRFMPPVPVEPWNEVLEATEDGVSCLQIDLFAVESPKPVLLGDEDCLTLNIYTPQLSPDTSLPVMVYFYGGGFNSGNASSLLYGPERLLDRDIVLVTVNYRLGVFGFISTGDEAAPGNYGLLDQNLALKWVQQFINAFGGDSSKVTIFGQSAGGASVSFHVISPLSKGLFHAGIQMSGNAISEWAINFDPLQTAITIAQDMQCPTQPTTDLIKCLRKRPALELLIKAIEIKAANLFPFIPTVDKSRGPNAFLPKKPAEIFASGEINAVPIMSGLTSDEAIQLVILFGPAFGGIDKLNSESLIPIFSKISPHLGSKDKIQIIYKKLYNKYFKNIDQSDWKQRLSALTKAIGSSYDKVVDDNHIDLAKLGIPTYVYKFSYAGQHSWIENSPEYYKIPHDVAKNLKLVGHVDEIQYLFKSGYFNSSALNERDQQMSDILLDLWTSFATTKVPTIKSRTGFSWNPLNPDKASYLNIDLNPQNVDGYLSDFELGEEIQNIRNIKTEL